MNTDGVLNLPEESGFCVLAKYHKNIVIFYWIHKLFCTMSRYYKGSEIKNLKDNLFQNLTSFLGVQWQEEWPLLVVNPLKDVLKSHLIDRMQVMKHEFGLFEGEV